MSRESAFGSAPDPRSATELPIGAGTLVPRTYVRYGRVMQWRCPTHGIIDSREDPPTCPFLLRRTIAGEAIAEPCGRPLEPIDDDD
jgi:hypothetical protein